MIDHNLYNWQNVDWETELEAYLDETAVSPITPIQLTLARSRAGRCIFFMQEYLEQKDYEYILHACRLGRDMARRYREIYIWLVQDQMDAPQPLDHPNCRCDLPYDEESEP